MVREKSKNMDKRLMGKKSRAAGQRFELKVRKDLEEQGWIVAKWTNNIELSKENSVNVSGKFGGPFGKLVKVKNKFLGPGRPMMLGAGFPDFICFKKDNLMKEEEGFFKNLYQVIGVESKMRGVLDKQEKEKCQWLLDNNIFSKILIASKGEKRGEIVYTEFNPVSSNG